MPKAKLAGMPTYDAVCLRSIRGVMEVFAGKWSFLVLEQLHLGTMRFHELSKALAISTKSLTDTLRHLEACGIIKRTVKPTVPVTVEYAMTPLGRTLTETVAALAHWAERNMDEVLAAQAAYDARLRAER